MLLTTPKSKIIEMACGAVQSTKIYLKIYLYIFIVKYNFLSPLKKPPP